MPAAAAFLLPAPASPGTRVPVKMTSPTRPPTPPLQPTIDADRKKEMDAAPTPTFAQIDGVSVNHLLQPPSPQTVLLCLHGFGASLFSFTPMLPYLATRPWLSILAYDAPGFGFTSRQRNLRYYTPAFSARVATTLADAYVPNRPYALCAHSMGSLAACRAALQLPKRIPVLILVAPALVAPAPLPAPLRLLARAIASGLAWSAIAASYLLGPLLAWILRSAVGSKNFWRGGLALARGDGTIDEDIVEGYFAPTAAKGWDSGVLNFCRAALRDRARALGQREDFVEMLRAMGDDMPRVLIVHGEKDRVVPLANSRRLAERLPGANLVVFDGCGHVPHEEEPELFTAVVAEFLEKAGLAVPEV